VPASQNGRKAEQDVEGSEAAINQLFPMLSCRNQASRHDAMAENKKGTLIAQSAFLLRFEIYFLAPRIASLAALATRNLTTFLAGI
jgi:hypothetical protein